MQANEDADEIPDDQPWRDEELLRELYLDRKWSMEKIGRAFDCSSGTVDYWIKKFGIETRPLPEAMLNTGTVNRANFGTKQSGYEVWNAYVRGEGIVSVRVHRLLAVAEYGFEAVCGKVVHHKNRIPWDNRPDNIEVMRRAEHGLHHHSKWAGGSDA